MGDYEKLVMIPMEKYKVDYKLKSAGKVINSVKADGKASEPLKADGKAVSSKSNKEKDKTKVKNRRRGEKKSIKGRSVRSGKKKKKHIANDVGQDRPSRRKFKRERIMTNNIDYLWECDLVDMAHLKKENDNVTSLLTCIDTFKDLGKAGYWDVPGERATMLESAIGTVKAGYDDVNVRIAISDEYTKMWNKAADKREHYTVLRKLAGALRNKPASGTAHEFTMGEIVSMLNEDIKDHEERENVKDAVTKAAQSSIDRIEKNVAKEIETGVDAVASDVAKKVIANPTIKKVIVNPVVKKAIDADGGVINASVAVKKSGKRSRRRVITSKVYTRRHGRLDKTIKGDGGSGNRKRVRRAQTTSRQLRKSLLKKLLKKKLMIK
eukprot:gene17820-9508_t